MSPSATIDAFRLDRTPTPQRVAELLREQIMAGRLRSGTRCAEVQLSTALGIARSTLREAFQLLIADGLLVREPHHGVTVRRLEADDVRDIYAMRRVLESAAIALPTAKSGLPAMRTALSEARSAARRGDWDEVGSADVRFHLAITDSAGSARLDRAMRALYAELRLAFQLQAEPRVLHEPFVARNAELIGLVEAGRPARARQAILGYLADAERLLLTEVDHV